METCWAYLVVSSDHQRETLPDQERWAESVAKTNGWEITRTFSDVSSDKDGVRELLESVLRELRATPKAQRPKRLLTIRIDRLGRGDGLDSIAALAEIRKLGVVVHTREAGDVKLERVTDSILPAIQAITAGIENEVRSDKWKAVHARRRAAGLHVGKVPFGVVLIDGRATPFEPEARIVREIFEKAAQGWGYTRLAAYAREHAPSKRQPDGSDKPYRWASSTIRTLMDSSTLRGLVIDEDLWERARALRRADFKTRSPKRWPWPLVGAVRCECGRMLRGHASGVKTCRIRYLICFDVSHGKPYPSHRADALEAQFLELLGRLGADPKIMLKSRSLRDETVRRAQELNREGRKALDAIEGRRKKAWLLSESDALTPAQLRERLDELDASRIRAQGDVDAAAGVLSDARTVERSCVALNDVLADIPALWPQLDTEAQTIIARAVTDLPEIGGLYASPSNRNQLLLGSELPKNYSVANKGKADDSITKKFIQSITE